MTLLINFILAIGLVISFIIVGLIFKKDRKNLHHYILAAIFICIIGSTVHFYALVNKVRWLALSSFFIDNPVVFIVSPLLLLYTKSLFAKEEKQLLKNHWFHFIPLALYFLLLTLPLFYYHLTKKVLFEYFGWLLENEAILQFQTLILLFYGILAFRFLQRSEVHIKNNFSNLQDKEISWIKHLVFSTILVALIDLASTIYELAFGTLTWDTGIIAYFFVVIMVLYLAYKGLAQSKILIPSFSIKNERAIDDLGKSTPKDEALESRLMTALGDEKVYLEADLTLTKLAEKVDSTNKKLSTLLNQHLDTSFYELVNQYRVQEVKNRLSSGEYGELTLLGVAMDAGFSSKTSFNRIFKNLTGLTPSAYKKAQKLPK